MWRRIEVNARVDHPVERVFAYLANPLLWHEFAPACVFRRQIGDVPPDVGSQWMATDQIGPFRFHFVDELAELEPNRRVVWLSSAPWNARVEYLCTADGDRTRIRATYQGDVVGFLQVLVGWLPARVFGWFLARDFPRLDRVLARETQAAERWHNRYPDGVPDPEAADLFAGVDSGRPAPADEHGVHGAALRPHRVRRHLGRRSGHDPAARGAGRSFRRPGGGRPAHALFRSDRVARLRARGDAAVHRRRGDDAPGMELRQDLDRVSVALWILSAVAGAIYLGPRAKRVGELFDAEGPTSEAGRALMNRLFLVSRLELLSFAIVIALMVFKPGS